MAAKQRVPSNKEITTFARIAFQDKARGIVLTDPPTVTHVKDGAWVSAKLWVAYANVDAGD